MQKYRILLCFERVSAKAMILDGLLGFPFEVEILEKPMVFSGLSVAGSSFLMKASSSQVPLPTSNFLGGRTRRPDQVVEPGGRTQERQSPGGGGRTRWSNQGLVEPGGRTGGGHGRTTGRRSNQVVQPGGRTGGKGGSWSNQEVDSWGGGRTRWSNQGGDGRTTARRPNQVSEPHRWSNQATGVGG